MDESQSKMIAWLRFPLMAGVVFIHAPINLSPQAQNGMPWIVYSLFSDIIPRMAVPLFFLLSGLLFFYGMELTWNNYKRKFINRFRSLFIPYVLWNIILVALFFVISHFETSRSFLEIGRTFGKSDYYKVAAQMWFLRDLMLMVVLSPLMALALRYLKYYWLVLLFFLWYADLWNLPWGTHLTESLFFFCCGAYLGLNRISLNRLLPGKYMWLFVLAYVVLIGVDLFAEGMPYRIFLRRADLVLGCILMLYLAKRWTERDNFRIGILPEASFFIFTTHIVLLNLYNRAFAPFACWESSVVIIYFLVIFLSLSSSVLLYLFCRKYLKRVTLILTGGR